MRGWGGRACDLHFVIMMIVVVIRSIYRHDATASSHDSVKQVLFLDPSYSGIN